MAGQAPMISEPMMATSSTSVRIAALRARPPNKRSAIRPEIIGARGGEGERRLAASVEAAASELEGDVVDT
ncbi:hypothetical protein CTTA_4236 [Comamonas testosteroni]|uniref:Uncharacterized protein n=1 Tax=Comamonas testosteroni TaxID=285 RepID=A0A5A7MJZ0_COMTE|nr:hypothetical protein CTTA_4236 [Comamonas testosteroni]